MLRLRLRFQGIIGRLSSGDERVNVGRVQVVSRENILRPKLERVEEILACMLSTREGRQCINVHPMNLHVKWADLAWAWGLHGVDPVATLVLI